MQPVGVDQRVSLGGDDLDIFQADGAHLVSDEGGGALHIVFMLRQGADAGNAEQVFEFTEKALLVFFCVSNCRGCHINSPEP